MRGMLEREWESGKSAWVCRQSGRKYKKCAESVWRCSKSRWKPRYISQNDIE